MRELLMILALASPVAGLCLWLQDIGIGQGKEIGNWNVNEILGLVVTVQAAVIIFLFRLLWQQGVVKYLEREERWVELFREADRALVQQIQTLQKIPERIESMSGQLHSHLDNCERAIQEIRRLIESSDPRRGSGNK